ncbi:Gfo/Idh/MocA family oxidoreductase [Alteromonas sp. ASW11-36]|uniref:Gfo/Idh/MocA family oxidoreductase n=1 Tax=Alteromonas arenosi TaxID=3055817 RepID=A0ABT7SXC5_9ALTE|nr:Gfo/Idh/MocA family oxidoreductase [Alteromonas sp. ASW11-36]MDM7860847.1 Gfo/Idh/MocA family oxidoreductase [Alteromonas sp. ASW11-36]
MADKHIRWGILGCGGIAQMFMSSIQPVANTSVVACAARNHKNAQAFANEHGIKTAYASYADLISADDLDAIYVANTHNAHYATAKACLEAGKPVLCEKPLTVNTAQSKALFELAKKHNVLLVEAVWTRFLPAIIALQEQLSKGIIGDVLSVNVNFSITGEFDPKHRLNNPETAGGSLLDLGIYPITMADIVFDAEPINIQSQVSKGPTGVDQRAQFLVEYPNEKHAMLSCAFVQHAPIVAIISGTDGYIEVPHFLGARELIVQRAGRVEQLNFEYPEGHNFTPEITQFNADLSDGNIHSTILPPNKTMRVMKIMDTLREQWQLRYPEDIESV